MVLAGGRGAVIRLPSENSHIALFAEDQSRYLISCSAVTAAEICSAARALSVPAEVIGTVGGDTLIVEGHIRVPLDELRQVHEAWFPALMSA
jgi:phosphoribosylformylglycinamidine synthase